MFRHLQTPHGRGFSFLCRLSAQVKPQPRSGPAIILKPRRDNWHNQLRMQVAEHVKTKPPKTQVAWATDRIHEVLKRAVGKAKIALPDVEILHDAWNTLERFGAAQEMGSRIYIESLRAAEGAHQSEVRWLLIKKLLVWLCRPRRILGADGNQPKHLMNRVAADWAWKTLARHKASGAVQVIELWKALVDQHASSARRDRTMELTAGLHQPIIFAFSLLTPQVKLRELFVDFLTTSALDHRVEGFIETHKLHESALDIYWRAFDDATQKRGLRWIRQVELAQLWCGPRGGSDALAGRIRRWADRSSTALLDRYWEAVKEASDPALGEEAWLQTDWTSQTSLQSSEEESSGLPESDDNNEQGTSGSADAPTRESLLKALSEPGFTPQILSSFLLSSVRCGMKDKAADIWRTIEGRGLPKSKALFDALLAGYGLCAKPREAELTMTAMIAAGHEPDALSSALLIRAHLRAGEYNVALQKAKELTSDARLAPLSASIYNRLLRSLFSEGLVAQAWQLLSQMPREGIGKPTLFTVNIFLYAHVRRRALDVEGYSRVQALFQEFDLKPDLTSFSIMMQVLLQQGAIKEAQDILVRMYRQGVTPNERAYGFLIHALVERGLPADFAESMRLLDEMKTRGLHPNEIIYSDIIRGMCFQSQNEDIDESARSKHIKKAESILATMKARNLPLNSVVYDSLISALLYQPSEKDLAHALALFREVQKGPKTRRPTWRGPMPRTWSVMLRALVKADQVAPAKSLVKEMERSGFQPTGSLERFVSDLRA